MKPGFLCIGAQKAATTWLYAKMGVHPRIWVPPIKELNYFNNISSTLFKRVFSRHWLDRNWRILFKRRVLKPLISGKGGILKNFKFDFRYFFLPRNFRWYLSLFPDDPGKIKGEFSVNYAVLGEPVISQISARLPNLKIIYLLRNPIFRTWSQAKMNLGKQRGHNLDELPEEKFYDYFNHPQVAPHSDYLTNLTVFKKYFPAEQIFVGFVDEIRNDPLPFLERLFDFLDVPFPREMYLEGLEQRVNAGIDKDIPPKYLAYLARMYIEQISQLHRLFNNAYTKEWLDTARQHLNDERSS
jgi:hypothetical protein